MKLFIHFLFTFMSTHANTSVFPASALWCVCVLKWCQSPIFQQSWQKILHVGVAASDCELKTCISIVEQADSFHASSESGRWCGSFSARALKSWLSRFLLEYKFAVASETCALLFAPGSVESGTQSAHKWFRCLREAKEQETLPTCTKCANSFVRICQQTTSIFLSIASVCHVDRLILWSVVC